MSRYTNRKIFQNRNNLYEEMREERDVKYFRQYSTPNMKYPTATQMREIKTIPHIWKRGDKFFKLAHEHYGDSTLWWVIAWFNKKPTESHVELGTAILIPKPISKVLKYLGNK